MKKSDHETNKKRGERLTECRRAAGLTQKELAERTFLTKQTISNIETGARGLTLSNAIEFGAILAVDPDYLLCKTDIASFKQFFVDNMSENAEAPIKSQILYNLIKSIPDCVKIQWCLNGRGKKDYWGWHIDILAKTDAEPEKYKSIHLDNATQTRLFDELCNYVGYLLFKQERDIDENLFSYAFSGEDGAGYSADEFQKAIDEYSKKQPFAKPVLYQPDDQCIEIEQTTATDITDQKKKSSSSVKKKGGKPNGKHTKENN